MLNGQKIVVVMPAYNAARTLRQTYDEVMAHGLVDLVIVVDDASHDETVAIARTLPNVEVEVHPENRGYGANQKTCYRLALAAGADIIIMIHPDYQYTPSADSSDGSSCRKRSLSLRARFSHSRRRRAARWHALVEIRFKPVPYVRGKFSHRSEALRVPHWLSGIFAPVVGAAAIANELQRFCFRQSDPRANHRPGMRDRRGDLPGSLHAGSVIDQFPPKRALRIRLSGYGCAFSFGTLGPGAADRLEMVQGRAISEKQIAHGGLEAAAPWLLDQYPPRMT